MGKQAGCYQGGEGYCYVDGCTSCPSSPCNDLCNFDNWCCDDIGGLVGELCCQQDCGPWRLFPNNCGGIELYGWIAAGFTHNADSPPSRYNGPLTFNDRDDEGQMNQVYAIAEKPFDGSCGWDWGGRVDFLYGTDGRFTQAVGLELNQDGTQGLNAGQRFYHMAIPQVYLDVGRGDWMLRAGHFYTIIGYEGVMAAGPNNFFYSHPYVHQYGEPFTHTGALLYWTPSDAWQLIGGVHTGWDTLTVANNGGDRLSFLGGVNWAAEYVAISVSGTIGDENDGTGAFRQRELISGVLTASITKRLSYALQADYGRQGVAGGSGQEWYGVNQYAYFCLTDCWSAGLRFEWFRDNSGTRVVAVGDGNPASSGGFAGNFYQATVGLNWRPWQNLVVRPEVRWDWFDPSTGIVARPFDDGAKNSQFTAAIDAVLTW